MNNCADIVRRSNHAQSAVVVGTLKTIDHGSCIQCWELSINAPRFDGRCGCGETRIISPVSELLPKRLSPELCDLQIKVAAQLPYRKASAILRELHTRSIGVGTDAKKIESGTTGLYWFVAVSQNGILGFGA